MIINLKQNEIVTALKGYITSQGINLVGKEVSIDFTAGRKNSGLSAEVTIEDDVKACVPQLVVVPTGLINREFSSELCQMTEQLVQEAVVAASVPEGETVKTSSLFG